MRNAINDAYANGDGTTTALRHVDIFYSQCDQLEQSLLSMSVERSGVGPDDQIRLIKRIFDTLKGSLDDGLKPEVLAAFEMLADPLDEFLSHCEVALPSDNSRDRLHAQIRRLIRTPIVHSTDFASVVYAGKTYSFTKQQAMVVSDLFHAWNNGTPSVFDETLIAELRSSGDKHSMRTVKSIFRGHSAWGTLIISG